MLLFLRYFLLGLLVRVYSKASSWTIQYRYDGLGRRVASKNSLGQHLQFFYADLIYPTRITHVYNHSSSEITSFYYDFQVGILANMKLHRMLNNVRRNYSIIF